MNQNITNERDRVVVIGGGIIGCSSARFLASDHEVLVIERGQIAGDASGKASGVITFSAQRSLMPGFVDYATSFFHDYEGTKHFEFVERNAVELTPPEKESVARKRVDGAVENGFPLSFLDSDDIDRRYPGVFNCAGYVGGIEYRDTGWVDPYTCTMSYKADAEARGAEVITNTEVTDIRVEDGSIAGVETDADEFIPADVVVCAAGWRSRSLLDGIVEIPVGPLRYQAVDLEPEWNMDDSYPMGLDPVTDFYWRPQLDGTLHVGGGDYLVSDPGERRRSVTPEYRTAVATKLPDCLEGFDEASVVSEDTCPTGDAATPDSLPILDAPATPDGLVIATGFHGYGIMSSPSAGRVVRSLVTGESCPFSIESIGIDRFETTGTDFDLISLAEKRDRLL